MDTQTVPYQLAVLLRKGELSVCNLVWWTGHSFESQLYSATTVTGVTQTKSTNH